MTRSRYRVSGHPFRKVSKAVLQGGSVTIMAPFKGYWWRLVLECGHTVERPSRTTSKLRGWARLWTVVSRDQVKPAPKRVRCEECPHEGS